MRNVTLFFCTVLRLIEKLKKVKDFRNDSGKRHPLWVVLLIIILGMMQSYTTDRALGDFAKNNHDLLITYFHLPFHRVPSRSTIRRILFGLDWSSLLAAFNEWAIEEYADKHGLKWLSIDGKSLKSTVSHPTDAAQNCLMFASFFSQDTGLVLNLQRWENKSSSEIHQVQSMVSNSALQNRVFSLDALHSNQITPQFIIDSGNDYLMALKANQLNLYKHVQEFTDNSIPDSFDYSEDKGH